MSGFEDHYRTLGITRDATVDEVKAAFRELAKKLHPDVNPGNSAAEEEFKRVNEAYTVLGDAAARSSYNADNAFAGFDWSKARSSDHSGRSRRQSVARTAWVRTAGPQPRESIDPIDLREWFRAHYGLTAAELTARMRAAEKADEERRGPDSRYRSWAKNRDRSTQPRSDGSGDPERKQRRQTAETYRSFAHRFRQAQRVTERAVPWIAVSVGFLALAVVMTVQRDGIPGDGRRPVPDR
jgi:curved DNA-binding protein CbpA